MPPVERITHFASGGSNDNGILVIFKACGGDHIFWNYRKHPHIDPPESWTSTWDAVTCHACFAARNDTRAWEGS